MSKVFLSWSGNASKSAAQALHAWLPTVIQSIHPYMSAEDIDKGERWSVDIAKQLEETEFGIICMTPENIDAPWVLFEAGALSKSMERSRVSPLLFELGPSNFTKSPLLQFQLTAFKKDDFYKLLQSINNSTSDTDRLRDDVLMKSFERSWSELEAEIGKIDFTHNAPKATPQRDTPSSDKIDTVLDELLSLARSQSTILRSPEDLLPRGYLQSVLGTPNPGSRGLDGTHPIWRDLESSLTALGAAAEASTLDKEQMARLLSDIAFMTRYVRDHSGTGTVRPLRVRLDKPSTGTSN
jgi:hypothetical protein